MSMTACLRKNTLCNVDQKNHQLSSRSSGRHVASVLFVAGTISNDELTSWSREVSISYVDGYTLFTLSSKTVGYEREVEPRLVAVRCFGDRYKVIFMNSVQIVEQSADESRLAIVNAAGDKETQQVRTSLNYLSQKYPSAFFNSIEPS